MIRRGATRTELDLDELVRLDRISCRQSCVERDDKDLGLLGLQQSNSRPTDPSRLRGRAKGRERRGSARERSEMGEKKG